MFILLDLIPPVKLAAITKKIAEKKDKITKIIPCDTKDYFEKGKKELIYQINKFNHPKTTSLNTPKNSLIDIYV